MTISLVESLLLFFTFPGGLSNTHKLSRTDYCQTCEQRLPVGNGKVAVIYRLTAKYRST